MLIFDEVVAALNHPQPWQAMYDLVMRDLHSGRTIQELEEQFAAWYPQVNELSLSENGADAFGDTYDRLIGYCRSGDSFRAILDNESSTGQIEVNLFANGFESIENQPISVLPPA